MIKGIARNAVIVKTPELRDIEQAIFIMSGEAPAQVRSQSELLALAGRIAGGTPARGQGRGALACAAWFSAGGATVALALWALRLFPAFF